MSNKKCMSCIDQEQYNIIMPLPNQPQTQPLNHQVCARPMSTHYTVNAYNLKHDKQYYLIHYTAH